MNLRPLGYEPNELPDCSTPHNHTIVCRVMAANSGIAVAREVRATIRDRGEPRGSAPPTPPDMRVRIRRFRDLCL